MRGRESGYLQSSWFDEFRLDGRTMDAMFVKDAFEFGGKRHEVGIGEEEDVKTANGRVTSESPEM